MTKRYVITGGPCSGKSSLVGELEKRGYKTKEEAARKIGEEYGLHPSDNFEEFQIKVIKKQLEFEEGIEKSDYDKIFLDRSPIDVCSYYKHNSMDLQTEIKNKLKTLDYEEVFLLDIMDKYETDEFRIETREEAEEIHKEINKTYQDFGYEPIKVPEFKVEKPIEKRANFVLEKII